MAGARKGPQGPQRAKTARKSAQKPRRGSKTVGAGVRATAGDRPPLVPHPNANGGQLYAGGVPGNRGGPGRPKNEVREALLDGFDEHGVALLVNTMRGEVPYAFRGRCSECGQESKGDPIEAVLSHLDVNERLRAAEIGAKYALGTQKDVTIHDAKTRVEETRTLLRSALPADLYKKLAPELAAIWNRK